MLEKISTERYEKILDHNKAIDKIAIELDTKFANFQTDMLLVGNSDLADYAKAFIESLAGGGENE